MPRLERKVKFNFNPEQEKVLEDYYGPDFARVALEERVSGNIKELDGRHFVAEINGKEYITDRKGSVVSGGFDKVWSDSNGLRARLEEKIVELEITPADEIEIHVGMLDDTGLRGKVNNLVQYLRSARDVVDKINEEVLDIGNSILKTYRIHQDNFERIRESSSVSDALNYIHTFATDAMHPLAIGIFFALDSTPESFELLDIWGGMISYMASYGLAVTGSVPFVDTKKVKGLPSSSSSSSEKIVFAIPLNPYCYNRKQIKDYDWSIEAEVQDVKYKDKIHQGHYFLKEIYVDGVRKYSQNNKKIMEPILSVA